MSRPIPNGIHPDYTLPQKLAKGLNINDFLCILPPREWNDITKVIQKHVTHYEGLETAKDTLKAMQTSFKIISEKSQYLALASFCQELGQYYTRNKVEFLKLYDRQLEKYRALSSEQHELETVTTQMITNKLTEKKRKLVEERAEASSSKPSKKKAALPRSNEATDEAAETMKPNEPSEPPFSLYKYITSIRAEGETVHRLYVNGEKLTDSDLRRMSSGLSSVIDTIDCSDNGQKALFNEEEWRLVRHTMREKYGIPAKTLNDDILSTWKLISMYASETLRAGKSKDYLNSVSSKESNDYTKKVYSIFYFILCLYEENEFLFSKKNQTKITEGDYASLIWCPLIRKVLFLNNNLVRLKFGETVNPFSSFNKSLQYGSSSLGMKVDYRFVIDIDRKEIDVGTGEAALEGAPEHKIYHDEGKLLREGKDVVDGLIHNCVDFDVDEILGCIIQTSGLSGEFSSVHLVEPQAYVSIPQLKFYIPRTVLELESFIQTLSSLITMTEKMESMARLILRSSQFFEDRRLSFGKFYGRPTTFDFKGRPNYLSWRAETYYFPANDEKKKSVVTENKAPSS